MKNYAIKWQSLAGFLALAAFSVALGLTIYARSVHAEGDPAQGEYPSATQTLSWTHVTTATGDLPEPTNSTQQVLALVADLSNDGVNDFVIGSRRGAGPSLVWYQRDAAGWTRHIIESGALQLEAGGATFDVDGDGDMDVVAGANAQNNEIWWWENPYPDLASGADWTRRNIKNKGATKHHDMLFGNFDDDDGTEFVYWNQNGRQLFMVDVPANPQATEPWPAPVVVFNAPDTKREGLAQADIDGDGKSDIIGGGYWFKHTGGTAFTAHPIEAGAFMRVAVGQLIPGGRPEIVQVPGDADGMGRWFQWDGNNWVGRDLPAGTIRQGHSLAIADANADGNLDIFIGEMRFPDNHKKSNPDARALLLMGDGQGNFTMETVAAGFGHHESRLADLDGDGDLDILGKPFTWDTPRVDIWLNNSEPSVCNASSATLANWNTHVIDAARPYRAVFVDSADLDGDGLPDIVTGAWWYRNPGLPGDAWTRHEIGAPFNQVALAADFDGDGDQDILGTVLAKDAPSHQPHVGSAFVWARNDGAGNFEILDNIDAGSGDFLQGALLGTFNDGSREVLLSWHNRNNALQSLSVPSDPAAEQWTIRAATPLSQSEDLSAGDIDGDGDDDLLLGTVWLANDGGNWTAHSLFDTPAKPDRNELADVNGDGRLDAVVGYEAINTPGALAWYEAPADPSQPWTEHLIDTIIGPMSLDAADLDGDGDIDIVAGEHAKANPTQGQIFAYENTPTGFQRHLIGAGDEHHDGAQLVDIDNDGDLDVVSIGWVHGRVLLYERVGCPPVGEATPTPTAETGKE